MQFKEITELKQNSLVAINDMACPILFSDLEADLALFEAPSYKNLESRKEVFKEYWVDQIRDLCLLKEPPLLTKEEIEQQTVTVLTLYRRFWKRDHYLQDQINIEIIAEDILDMFDYKINYTDSFTDQDVYGLTDFDNRIIYINLTKDPKTIRLTVAHELFHVLYHAEYALRTQKPIHSHSSLEMNAKDFARMLLLPKKKFEEILYDESSKDIDWIFDKDSLKAHKLRYQGAIWNASNRLGVSTKAIEIRIKELKLIDPDVAEQCLLSRKFNYKSHFEAPNHEF
jgi:Zn-dependent peptidase ImmA (M78 family)